MPDRHTDSINLRQGASNAAQAARALSSGYSKEIKVNPVRPPSGPAAGDMLLVERPLLEASSGSEVGTLVLVGVYVRVDSGSPATCLVAVLVALADQGPGAASLVLGLVVRGRRLDNRRGRRRPGALVQLPDREVQRGREADPREVGHEQHRGKAADPGEQHDGGHDRRGEQQDLG